ncbi:J domain-containing protein, partial [Pseudoduganella buxea]
MTHSQCLYECLKVTRDAPAEVIRAAYRSLSQKHHPDKNIGNQDAASMMSRLNFAYSVLSDAEQRRRYDAQVLRQRIHGSHPHAFHEPAGDDDYASADAATDAAAARGGRTAPGSFEAGKSGGLLHLLRKYAAGRDGKLAAVLLGSCIVLVVVIFWRDWTEQQSMLLLEQAAVQARGAAAPAAHADDDASGTASIGAIHMPEAAGPQVVMQETAPKAPAVPESPAPASKASELERLTAMLKSMGLGLHRLDLPTPPPNEKRVPARAAPAESDKAAMAATATSAPSRSAAPAPVVPPEPARAREEPERAAAPDADAKA